MHLKICRKVGTVALGCALLLSIGAGAQERNTQVASRPGVRGARAGAYDAKRETILQGMVGSYTESSKKAPNGAHVTVQTASGIVDVHLGPASYLQNKHFSLAAGDTVRFAGVSVVVNGTNVFLARTVQKGNQVLAIRSPHGSLLANNAGRMMTGAEREQMKQQGRPR